MTWNIRKTKVGQEVGTYAREKSIGGGYTVQRGQMVRWWAGTADGGEATSPRSAKKLVEKAVG